MDIRPGIDAVAYASHEVRTYLHIIAGLAAMVDVDGPAGSNREAVSAIQLAAADADRVLGDLVVAHDEGDASSASVRWIIASQVWAPRVDIASWVRVWRSLASQHGTRIHVRVADSVPARVMGDAPHLRQIIAALISNAIKFSEGGNVRVHVAAEYGTAEHAWLAVEVSDDGLGIEVHALERIFEPRQQASEAVHARFGGSGMGLAVGRALARAMGGDITVRSRPGKGAAFKVTVPLVPALAVGPLDSGTTRSARGEARQRSDDTSIAAVSPAGPGGAHGLQLVRRLFREVSGLGGLDASPIDIEILGAVERERAEGRSPSLKSVQANLCRAKTVVKYHVDQLVDKQLLHVSTDERDRRRSVFVLTARAETLIAAFEKVVRELVDEYHPVDDESGRG